jgi:hypothetical protein
MEEIVLRRTSLIFLALLLVFLLFWGLFKIDRCPPPRELNLRQIASVSPNHIERNPRSFSSDKK